MSIKYDSNEIESCDFCLQLIKPEDDKIVHSKADGAIYIYHADCDAIRRAGREARYREFTREHDRGRREII